MKVREMLDIFKTRREPTSLKALWFWTLFYMGLACVFSLFAFQRFGAGIYVNGLVDIAASLYLIWDVDEAWHSWRTREWQISRNLSKLKKEIAAMRKQPDG